MLIQTGVAGFSVCRFFYSEGKRVYSMNENKTISPQEQGLSFEESRNSSIVVPFLRIFLPGCILIVALSLLVFLRERKYQLEFIKDHERITVTQTKVLIQEHFNPIRHNLQFLAESNALKLFLADTARNRRGLQNDFITLVKNERSYDQLRFLDETGMEIVRVNQAGGDTSPILVPDNELQSKGGRYYFTDAYKLERGQIFVSPLDLNVEHDKIEVPHKPTLRIGTPVFDGSGKKRGIVLINVLGHELLKNVSRADGRLNKSASVMLLNKEGYWLRGRTSVEEWGFMFPDGKDNVFAAKFPASWPHIHAQNLDGQFQNSEGLFTYSRVKPFNSGELSSTGSEKAFGPSAAAIGAEDYYWFVVTHISPSSLNSRIYSSSKWILSISLLGVALLAFASFRLATAKRLKKQADSEAREAAEKVRLILDSTAEAIYGIDLEGRCTLCNSSFLKMTGYEQPEQLLGVNMHELIHHTHADGSHCDSNNCRIFQATRHGIETHVDDELFWRADGTSFPAEYWSFPIYKNGDIVGAVVTFVDITQRKQAEDRRSIFIELLDNAEHIAVFKDTQLRYVMINRAYTALTGLSLADVVGKSDRENFAEFSTEPQIDKYMENDRQALALPPGQILTIEEETLAPDGSTKTFLSKKFPVYAQEGHLLGGGTVTMDITARKQAQYSLQRSEEMMLISQSVAHICSYSTNLNVNKLDESYWVCSPEFYKIFGIDKAYPHTIAGWAGFIHPDHREELVAYHEDVVKNRTTFSHDYKIIRINDGAERWVHGTGELVYDEHGNPIRMHGAIQDITERKRIEEEKHALEQQFQQTQKLESLGVLAGGIAHDFNNILAIIMGYCSLTKMDYDDAEKHIPEIEKAAERAAALCRQMLAYAGKATLAQEQVNTWMLVDEMVTMLKTTIQKNVVIKAELGTDIPFIIGDGSQIRQVVMNLIINAAEAIGDAEGAIDVTLVKAELKAKHTEKDHLGFIIPAGRYICFEVSDNGCGMDEEARRKIFEPFYTTKFTGRGLGMSAVLGIIKAHNGALQLESHPGQGTTFKVYLPVQVSNYETEEAQQKATSEAWHGSGTILLAEDEEQIREVAIILLQELGFTVLDAANGKKALELYQQNAADISLVITDIGMPVMNGYELFYELKQLNPQLPIIISSGFGEGDIDSKIPRDEIAGLINKPYNFDQLREVLRAVVEGIQ